MPRVSGTCRLRPWTSCMARSEQRCTPFTRYSLISSSVMSVGSPPKFVLATDAARRGGSKPCFCCIFCKFSTVSPCSLTPSDFGASSASNGSGSAFSHPRHIATLFEKWSTTKNNKNESGVADEKKRCYQAVAQSHPGVADKKKRCHKAVAQKRVTTERNSQKTTNKMHTSPFDVVKVILLITLRVFVKVASPTLDDARGLRDGLAVGPTKLEVPDQGLSGHIPHHSRGAAQLQPAVGSYRLLHGVNALLVVMCPSPQTDARLLLRHSPQTRQLGIALRGVLVLLRSCWCG